MPLVTCSTKPECCVVDLDWTINGCCQVHDEDEGDGEAHGTQEIGP